MLELDVFIPIYQASAILKKLLDSVEEQKGVQVNRIILSITDSADADKSKAIAGGYPNVTFFSESPTSFSHSLTREKGIITYCSSPIVALLSQDVIFCDNQSLYRLASALTGDVIYAYGRQISQYHNIEKYTRERNYPATSCVVGKEDIPSLQFMAFFVSDAFSALKRDKFIELHGYDQIPMSMNEDEYYAYKTLMAGYKKAYVADAVVYHSHHYKFRQLYHRYYETGKWFSQHPEFDQYSATKSGFHMSLYICRRALREFNIPVLFRFVPDMLTRYFGMKNGRRAGRREIRKQQ
jgi:rhamnosyltransferase